MVDQLDAALNRYHDALTLLEQAVARLSQRRSRDNVRSKNSSHAISQDQLVSMILKVLRSCNTVQSTLAATPITSNPWFPPH